MARPGHRSQKTQKAQSDRAERVKRAFKLRIWGWTFAAIGRRIGVDADTASAYVREHLANIPKQEADELRSIEFERLERVQAGLRRRAEGGDEKAAAVYEKVSASKRRMLGLDAPVRIAGADGGALKLALDGDLRGGLLDKLFNSSASGPARPAATTPTAGVETGGEEQSGRTPGDGSGGSSPPAGDPER